MPLVRALESGVRIGRAAGGRGGIGLALKGVADRLKATRETEEAVGVLGRTERVKAKIKKEFAPPIEYKPTTKPEALEFERAKARITAKPTKWDIQKEARITVNAMINQNSELQMQAFEKPSLITDLIDKEITRLNQQYGLSQVEADTLDLGKKSLIKKDQETLINQYMKKYPNRSREEIIRAMPK